MNSAKGDIAGGSITATTPSRAQVELPRRVRYDAGWLRDMPWLTRKRIVFYSSVLLLAYMAASTGQFLLSHGLTFQSDAPIGGDFVNPYAGSIAGLAGDPASAYDLHLQHMRERAMLGDSSFGVLAFSYPPVYLLMVLPLSLLPYVASWLVFEAATLAGYLAVLRRIASGSVGL